MPTTIPASLFARSMRTWVRSRAWRFWKVCALPVLRVEADVPDVLLAGGPDVDLAQLRPRPGGQPPRALQGARRGAEARHGDGQDARPGQPQQVEGPGADEEGEGRVEAAGQAEDDALHPHVLDPSREAGGLDREDLAAPLVERRRLGGDEGVRVDRADEPVRLRRRHGGEDDRAVGGAGVVDGVGERGLPRALDAAGARRPRRSRPARPPGGSAPPRRGERRSRRPAGGRRRRGRSWTRGRRRWRRRRRRGCGPTAGARAPGGTRPWPRGRSRPRGSG